MSGSYERALSYINEFEFVYGRTFVDTWSFSLGISFIYLMVIYLLQSLMQNRQKMELRAVSLVHNFIMFAVSLLCCFGLLHGAVLAFQDGGIERLLCGSNHGQSRDHVLAFWQYIFWLSKIYELMDTVILCFRRSKIIFLHLYHHWITNILAFFTIYYGIPQTWAAAILNTFVHIPMYLYYFLAILNIRPWWKRYITQIQIIQFVLVIAIHSSAFFYHYVLDGHCHAFSQGWWINVAGMSVIWSYLILFIFFYRRSYVTKVKKSN